jgi:hypothetical protein
MGVGGVVAGSGGTSAGVGQGQPLVMPGFPMRAAAVPNYSPYSPSRFHIDKRCQHRCSWKCFSIALIFVTVALVAMLAYFAGELPSSYAFALPADPNYNYNYKGYGRSSSFSH